MQPPRRNFHHTLHILMISVAERSYYQRARHVFSFLSRRHRVLTPGGGGEAAPSMCIKTTDDGSVQSVGAKGGCYASDYIQQAGCSGHEAGISFYICVCDVCSPWRCVVSAMIFSLIVRCR